MEETLERLIARELVARLDAAARPEGGALRAAPRRRGRRHRPSATAPRPVLARDPLEERVAALEAEVAALRAALTELGL